VQCRDGGLAHFGEVLRTLSTPPTPADPRRS
jgi:hypothetical protein